MSCRVGYLTFDVDVCRTPYVGAMLSHPSKVGGIASLLFRVRARWKIPLSLSMFSFLTGGLAARVHPAEGRDGV